MSPWPFSVLEVEAGASERDIKRAYARKLKTVHPEDDPAGFQALREAYEAALSGHWRAPEPQADKVGPVEPELSVTEPASPTPARTLVPASPSADEDLWELKDELVHCLHDPAATDEDRRAALAAVLASPALENVGRMAEVEAWVGALIAEHPGVTDPLLDPVISRFAWDQERRWDIPWFVAAVLARRDALVFSRQMHDPASRLHAGYKLLQRPPGGWFTVFRASNKVRPVLRLLDAEPGLQPEFDYETVEAWRTALDRLPFNPPQSRGSIWRLVFLIFWIGLIIVKCSGEGFLGDKTDRSPQMIAADSADACRDAARAPALMPDAEPLCNEAQLRDEHKIAALSDSALVYLRKQDWGTAKALYDTVLKLSPNDARALYGRGLAHLELGSRDLGMADMARAHWINPSVVDAFAQWGFASAPKPDDINPNRDRPLVTGKAGVVYIPSTWATIPSQADIDRHYPDRALRLEKNGRIGMDCAVVAGGTLSDCFILTETPADLGFADAAMMLTRDFRVKASGETGDDGLPFRVKFAVNFQMAGQKT